METKVVKCSKSGNLIGEVVVEIRRRGPYNKIWSAVVVDRTVYHDFDEEDVPSLGQHFHWAEGASVGEISRNPHWEEIPPHPICPRCGRGDNIGYSYEGTRCSCSQRVGGEIVTCWEGEPHELIEDPAGISNPWVRAISHPGCA